MPHRAPTTLPRALPPEQNCRYSGANETRAALSAANGVCTDGQAPQRRRHRRGSRVRRAHRPGPGIRDLACRAQGPKREGRFVWARAGKVSGWSSATQSILHGGRSGRIKRRRKRPRPRQVVGREGFEPPTSRLSSVRSDTELPARPSGNYLVPTGLAIHRYVTCNDLQIFFFRNSKNFEVSNPIDVRLPGASG
jgi:hypothetical protein